MTSDGEQRKIEEEEALAEYAAAHPDSLYHSFSPDWISARYSDAYSPEQENMVSILSNRYGAAVEGVIRLNETYDCYKSRDQYYVADSFYADGFRMRMNGSGSNLDDGLLIMNDGSHTTEVYDTDTKKLLYTIGASDLYIKDGFIYDPYAYGTGLQYKYDLNLTGEALQTLADRMLTSVYGKRSMNPQERAKYAMDGVLYEEMAKQQ